MYDKTKRQAPVSSLPLQVICGRPGEVKNGKVKIGEKLEPVFKGLIKACG